MVALPTKVAAAFELIPINVGTHAAGSVATFAKLDEVPQAIFPFASVTAGAANILTVEYTQNPVGDSLLLSANGNVVSPRSSYTVAPPVTAGSGPANISVF